MKIALIGYGKMGKAIEQIALQHGYTITCQIDAQNLDQLYQLTPAQVDMAIEFSQPTAAYHNIYTCLQKGIPVISGTTGWLERKPEIEQFCREKQGTFFYATNFSIAAHILFKLNAILAKYMNHFPTYEVSIEETHAITKKDQPSGTAIQLAEDIVSNLSRKEGWVNEDTQTANKITIVSHRTDQSIGTHLVKYTSAVESLELKHIAYSRESFAQGVILVAEWLKDKKGVLTMEDFLPFKHI